MSIEPSAAGPQETPPRQERPPEAPSGPVSRRTSQDERPALAREGSEADDLARAVALRRMRILATSLLALAAVVFLLVHLLTDM
ncbi:MAG TPA: hypothetical protein K8V08_13480, partial [Brevibacterium senegalense]|nr:hypothetical protein [Brevibacterium senegalense]